MLSCSHVLHYSVNEGGALVGLLLMAVGHGLPVFGTLTSLRCGNLPNCYVAKGFFLTTARMDATNLTLIQSVERRLTDEGESMLRLLSTSNFDLQETDSTGVNAFWICNTVYTKTSLRDIKALLQAARGYQTEDGGPLLLFCALESTDDRERLVMVQPSEADYVDAGPVDDRTNLCTPQSEAEGMLYSKMDLKKPAWRWVVRKGREEEIVNRLGRKFNIVQEEEEAEHASKKRKTDTTSGEWVLLCTTSRDSSTTENPTPSEPEESLLYMDVAVVNRYILNLAEMAPYARRQVFSGLWMACRAGNCELLDFLLTPGFPWAAVVKRAFGFSYIMESPAGAQPVEEREVSVGDVIWGEVWREMDLPQRTQSCGQAALMSANLDLIRLLQNRLGAEAFWNNCRYMGDTVDGLLMNLNEISSRFEKHGLLRVKGQDLKGKDQAVSQSRENHVPSKLQRRLYEWSMVQSLAIAAFVRESERPLTGSITTFIRLARGDIECTEEHLHGPNLFRRTVEVLGLIHEQMALDPLISEFLAATPKEDPYELLITLLLYFALPFYWSVQSGNLPAFRFLCDRIRTVVDGLLEIDNQKFVEHLQTLKTAQHLTENQLVGAPLASSLVIGLLTGVPVEVRDRRALWQALVAGFRFKTPDWFGATGAYGGVHNGGPDPNGFPRDFELQSWCDELIFDELLQSLWWLHLATTSDTTPAQKQEDTDWFWVPGGAANFLQTQSLKHVNFSEKDKPATVFWTEQLVAFRASLEQDHKVRGIKVLKKGETPEVDWQQFLSRF